MPPDRDETSYHGFSLRSVCWGYRDIFRKIISGLMEKGAIGPGREKVTGDFFDLLKKADQSCFDHVLKEFLGALDSRARWILDVPGVFSGVVNLGRRFAEAKLYCGISYFQVLGEGGFGSTPDEVKTLVDYGFRLIETDHELALAFVKGYRRLLGRLKPDEIGQFVNEGLAIYHRNGDHGIRFMEGKTKSSENIIRSITRECRIEDMTDELEGLLRALAGYGVEVDHLGKLDSDDLIERGSMVVCMYKWLYLPASVRHFEDPAKNKAWYLLMAVCSAGMLAENSFSRIHGLPRYSALGDAVGEDMLSLNLAQIVEYVRVTEKIKARWPGARGLLEFGWRNEFANSPPVSPAEKLLEESVFSPCSKDAAVTLVRHTASRSVNIFSTVELLDEGLKKKLLEERPGLDAYPLGPVAFLPDFLFPGSVSSPPMGDLVADLKDQAAAAKKKRESDGEKREEPAARRESGDKTGEEGEEGETAGVAPAFVYDEWNNSDNDYYRDYCFVHEQVPETGERHSGELDSETHERVQEVRRVFERLKPDTAGKEKHLAEGDVINPDLLMEHLVQSRLEPSPRVNFYEKPLTKQRDLAVLILLDVSGSTGETAEQEKVIDIEKRAAVILGEGLKSLGDTFSICGFSGNGRKECAYYVYHDFQRNWDLTSVKTVLNARPSNATRIGAALRHSGFRLSALGNRQRIIILITDGKPMDSDYDPNTRYAQYDVRKACEENSRIGIDTFGISTEENTVSDMEIMFPHHRFAILPNIKSLPRILPKLYIRMTV
ncbi:MAG: VWA domain-containing protein [Kiritimatiellia bacterium]